MVARSLLIIAVLFGVAPVALADERRGASASKQRKVAGAQKKTPASQRRQVRARTPAGDRHTKEARLPPGPPGGEPGRAVDARAARAQSQAASRCRRDIFCGGVQVITMERRGREGSLTYAHVERVMGGLQHRLQPCVVQARRAEPRLGEPRIEFVVSPAGRVLAARVNGQRRSTLARCIEQQLRRHARFPRGRQRQVAEFRLAIVH